MGDLMPGIPSIPGDETTWTSFVDQFETLKKGDNSVSLTPWDTGTDAVSIVAGSSIEIAGATYRFTSDEAVTGGADGVVYVMILGGVPTLVNDPPVWRDDLNGWYNATGDGRYTGHRMRQDGGNYYDKMIFSGNHSSSNVLFSGAGGSVISEGFGKFDGGINTDGDRFYFKKVLLNLSSSGGSIAHELDWSTIVSVTGGYERSTGNVYTAPNSDVSVYWDEISVHVLSASSDIIPGTRPFVVIYRTPG